MRGLAEGGIRFPGLALLALAIGLLLWLTPRPAATQPSCPAGRLACSGICVNQNADPYNCGACGRSCGSGRTCMAGACVASTPILPSCSPGYMSCSGRCANLMADPNNCGRCGGTCASGQTCSSGVCRATAPARYACRITNGRIAGQTVLPQGMAYAGPVGAYCSDGRGDSGVQVNLYHPY